MIICCMMQLYIIIKILLIVSSWIGCENNINHILLYFIILLGQNIFLR